MTPPPGILRLNDSGGITDFPANNISILLKFKEEITGETDNVSTKDVEIIAPLKYLSNYCKSLEMPLIKWDTNWSANCFIPAIIFALLLHYCCNICNKYNKTYVQVVNSSTQDNAKLLQQSKPGLKKNN